MRNCANARRRYSAAPFFSVQQEGFVLAGTNFALGGGDTHISLDRTKDGTIQARDLRLRFEFGAGAASSTSTALAKLDEPLSIALGNSQNVLYKPRANRDE